MDEPKEVRLTCEHTPVLYCAFCDKSQLEVRKLVARPSDEQADQLTICDECVETSAEIIEEQSLTEAEQRPKALFAYIVRQHEIIDRARGRAERALQMMSVSMPPSTDSQH